MAAAFPGDSSVIFLTMQGWGMLPGGDSETDRSQSIAEQTRSGPRVFVIRCTFGIASREQLLARSRRKMRSRPTRMKMVLVSGAFQPLNWFIRKQAFCCGWAVAGATPDSRAIANPKA